MGSNALDIVKENNAVSQHRPRLGLMGYEERKAAVHEEMQRMNQLPANSSYATHRLRVLNKILQLMSIERTASQEQELELLFARLSM